MTAVGTAAVGFIVKQMKTGYSDTHYIWVRDKDTGKFIPTHPHTQIRTTGDLMRDVNSEVDMHRKSVRVGNSLKYALFVHEGTHRMKGRPYIKDGIEGNIEALRDIAARYLKEGF